MNKIRHILLAEDNINDAELTLEALSENNLANEVVVVSDGAETLDYLYYQGNYRSREPIDPILILLDIKMPKVNGIEVLRKIKSDEKLKTIPVIMLTSSREEKDLVDSYKLGVNAYVVKPVDFEQFLYAVKQIGLFWLVINQAPPNKNI
ncbi:MAG: response regulator [Acidobacteria bacterium]|nr:response regulator [Acidobacteriota bacterium]